MPLAGLMIWSEWNYGTWKIPVLPTTFVHSQKEKLQKNRGASAENQIPAKNRRLQTANECNSEKKIQNKIISGVAKIPARIISPSRY